MNKKSIIIPAYNEEEGICEVIKRCKKVCGKGDEIIVVDDGSKDNTARLARNEKVRVVSYKKNKGKAGALFEGFKAAKNNVIVTIDADCTYPPEEIPRLMKAIDEKKADVVVGSRFRRIRPKGMPSHRVWANILGAEVSSLILGRKITDVTSGLRAFRKSIMNEIPITAKGLDFEAEFTARAITMGYDYLEVPIQVEERKGTSKLNFFKHLWLFFKAVVRGRLSK